MDRKALQTAFERFWTAYPKRRPNPKAMALSLFERLVRKGEDAEQLITAAERYAQECAALGVENDFIVHAKTFLRQRRFEDYQASAPAEAAPSPDGPDHPLAFLLAEAGPADFGAWIAQLRVEIREGRTTIVGRTGLALNQVERRWGSAIRQQLGPVDWAVDRKD
ncbi:MAG: hypothetical protein ACK4RV_11670 [Caulobacter sp.]